MRNYTETERIKIGNLAAVYFHYLYDAEGNVVERRISVPGRYTEKDVGLLIGAIAARINAGAE